MNFIKIFLCMILICALPGLLNAELYMWTDENGNQHFSNTQPPDDITSDVTEEVPSSGQSDYQGPVSNNQNIKYDYEDCLPGGACIGQTFKCHSDIQDLIQGNDYPFIEVMIKENPSVVNAYECEVSPLLASTAWGHEKISRLLIEKGADVNFKHSEYGLTPLHQAVRKRSLDTVKLLIEKGADVNAATFSSSPCLLPAAGATPLHFALIYQGPPLSRCYSTCVEIIKTLIKNNANPYARNALGITPIDIAKQRGDWDMIEKIYKELGMVPPDR